jgi:hypothetical protein
LFVFLIIAILTGVRWNLSVILICISLMAKDAEHFFMYLLTICTSFEKCLYNSFTHLVMELFVLLVFDFFWVLYISCTLVPCQMNSW